jgi:hypothetical protein
MLAMNFLRYPLTAIASFDHVTENVAKSFVSGQKNSCRHICSAVAMVYFIDAPLPQNELRASVFTWLTTPTYH